MILAAFRSEWIKLRRPTLLYGTYAGLAAAASLFAILMFTQATTRVADNNGLPSLSDLAKPNGLVHGMSRATILLGVVAFGLAAAQIAGEYGLGTLRQLLVRQPRRPVLLAGKYLAVISFMVGAVLFASVVAMGVSVVLAHARHIPTGAWFSSAGVSDLTRALLDLVLAVIGYATLGLTVGLFLRSSVFAVVAGIAWLLAVESVIVRVVASTSAWLPGTLLETVGQGGTATASFSHALVVSVVYLVAIGIAATVVFARKDVTA
ncbi:MAG TPA: ABC transporter permease [Acidimicrobiales bacterium]|jgi:ABC-type transport system involved in multi-copper enzyme maturation permease subunit|nr:ABC transporter permease [Acidimicrobiales bacterium]